MFAPVSIPNATCFSPDGRTAYFCDTPKQAIMQVEIDPETGKPVAEARLFADLSADGLNPDGAVIDAEGCLWNAQWGPDRWPDMTRTADLCAPSNCRQRK